MSGPTAEPLAAPWPRIAGDRPQPLESGWRAAGCAPDSQPDPAAALERLDWIAARAPGTAAGALLEAGLWRPGEPHDFDAEDWWFETSFQAEPPERQERALLRLDGVATVYEVHLNDELVLECDSMFAAHSLDVSGLLAGDNRLVIRCRALKPLLARRRHPRARWRTRLVADGRVRSFRTSLLGRAPGFSPGPVAVGPWRPASLERWRHIHVEDLHLRPRMHGEHGVLAVQARLAVLGEHSIEAVEIELKGPTGTHRAALALSAAPPPPGQCTTDHPVATDRRIARGSLAVRGVEPWWPHTHGAPTLYEASLRVRGAEEIVVEAGQVGFRELRFSAAPEADLERNGLDLRVNGVDVFARGAVWTPVDPINFAPSEADLRQALEQVRDAGMNMLRVPGVGSYETEAFHELCDRLGIFVWQDLMFANLDYPLAAPEFAAAAEREAAEVLQRLGGGASLAVICGNSEIDQQVAMLGLDPALGRSELFARGLPRLLREQEIDAAYLPSAPCGGELPFRPDRGVANYYGVGGYCRPLDDARLAGVRFAAECLAFSNVPGREAVDRMLDGPPGQLVVHHPAWKAGVPRDTGAGWDFEDVRDHYLQLLFGIEPLQLRSSDHERYLELSRAVSGEVMAEVFGEWRRRDSGCKGGLVLWLRDLLPGAGWGVIDDRGEPKAAYHDLRRALAPIAVWSTDEGLGGIRLHVANDRGVPLACRLRVAVYRDREHPIAAAAESLQLGPHESRERDVEAMLERFIDASFAYRFGPAGHDLIVAGLERERSDGSTELLSQSLRFPLGRPAGAESAERLGLRAAARQLQDGSVELSVQSRRLAYRVSPEVPGFLPEDDFFSVEPGSRRILRLCPREPGASLQQGTVRALNLEGQVGIAIEAPAG